MSYTFQNNYTMGDDITLNMCVDFILSSYNMRR